MENIQKKIMTVMSVVLETPIEKINENSSTDTIENWDSLHHLNLIVALEEEFNVTIPDEEVGNLTNYKLIEITINELLK